MNNPNGISYELLGDALIKRGKLDQVIILLDDCYSSDYRDNLIKYLREEFKQNNIHEAYPVVVAWADINKNSYGDVFFLDLEKAKKVTLSDLLNPSRNTLGLEKPTVVVTVPDDLIKRFPQFTPVLLQLHGPSVHVPYRTAPPMIQISYNGPMPIFTYTGDWSDFGRFTKGALDSAQLSQGDQAMNAGSPNEADQTIDQLPETDLQKLIAKLLFAHGINMRIHTDSPVTIANLSENLKWLAGYEGGFFDRPKQDLYKKVIVRGLRQVNSQTAGTFARLFTRIYRFRQMNKMRTPAVILASEEKMLWECIMTFLTGEDLIQMYEPQISRMNDIPKSSLFPEADYEQWARSIILHNRNLFGKVLGMYSDSQRRSPNSAIENLFTFFGCLPLDQQRPIAEVIIKRLNDPANTLLIGYPDYMSLIEALPKKVGALKNLKILEYMYKLQAKDFF